MSQQRKPLLLDLFCGAGGAAMGYHRAGFEVVGVDINQQPGYPFEFHQGDAVQYLFWHWNEFDAFHASPPCQSHSALRHMHPSKSYACFIADARNLFKLTGKPYIIENVPKAPLLNSIQLCGSAFGLRVRRHRIFESNVPLCGTECNHESQGRPIDVSGTGGRRVNDRPDGGGGNPNKPRNIQEAREAMGIDWMTRKEIAQAIPPAYTEFLGRQLMAAVLAQQSMPTAIDSEN